MWHCGSRPPLGWTGADNDRVLNITSVRPSLTLPAASTLPRRPKSPGWLYSQVIFGLLSAVLGKTCSVCKYYEWWAGFPHWTWDRNNRNSSISRVSSAGRGRGRGGDSANLPKPTDCNYHRYNTIQYTVHTAPGKLQDSRVQIVLSPLTQVLRHQTRNIAWSISLMSREGSGGAHISAYSMFWVTILYNLL